MKTDLFHSVIRFHSEWEPSMCAHPYENPFISYFSTQQLWATMTNCKKSLFPQTKGPKKVWKNGKTDEKQKSNALNLDKTFDSMAYGFHFICTKTDNNEQTKSTGMCTQCVCVCVYAVRSKFISYGYRSEDEPSIRRRESFVDMYSRVLKACNKGFISFQFSFFLFALSHPVTLDNVWKKPDIHRSYGVCLHRIYASSIHLHRHTHTVHKHLRREIFIYFSLICFRWCR